MKNDIIDNLVLKHKEKFANMAFASKSFLRLLLLKL